MRGVARPSPGRTAPPATGAARKHWTSGAAGTAPRRTSTYSSSIENKFSGKKATYSQSKGKEIITMIITFNNDQMSITDCVQCL